MNIDVCELLKEINMVSVVGLLYRVMEAFFANRDSLNV